MKKPEFGLQLRIITALPFVLPQNAVNSLDELCVNIGNHYDGDAD